MRSKEELAAFMQRGGDWEKQESGVNGVAVMRLPPTLNRSASLAVEINPLNAGGRPMKLRGLLILTLEEFIAFREIFNNTGVLELVAAMEAVVPHTRPRPD